MKRMICVIMAAALLLSLAACGGGDAENSYVPPAQGTAPAQEPTPDPTEPQPSLDEVMYDILWFVEDADLQLIDDAPVFISDMYSGGITDAYHIFEELCSLGFCIPKSDDLPGGSGADPNGVIVVDVTFGNQRIYNSTGSYSCTEFTVRLDTIDPDTGTVETIRTFTNEETHSCDASIFGYSLNPTISTNTTANSRKFDADLRRMTATHTLSDGSVHVGWIDESGTFTDVSDLIGEAAGDFGGLTKHLDPLFGPQNYFYFRDRSTDASAVKRVPLDNITKDAVEVLIEKEKWGGTILYPLPDGSVVDGGSDLFYDESMSFAAKPGYFIDWISPSLYVGTDHEDSNKLCIYNADISAYADQPSHRRPWYSEKTPLTPDIKGRECLNAVVSPDAAEVAFLSRLTTGTDTNYYLFIVPVDGGEPRKVQTDYNFVLPQNLFVLQTNSHADYLLDWI